MLTYRVISNVSDFYFTCFSDLDFNKKLYKNLTYILDSFYTLIASNTTTIVFCLILDKKVHLACKCHSLPWQSQEHEGQEFLKNIADIFSQ